MSKTETAQQTDDGVHMQYDPATGDCVPSDHGTDERASANQQQARRTPITSYADHELEVMRKYGVNPFVSFTQDEIEAEIARRWTLVTGFRS